MSDIQQVITSSTLIHTGIGALSGLVVSVDGSTPATLTCYDNTSASGKVIFQAHISPESAQQPFEIFFADRFAPRFLTGLYISLGTAMSANVWARGL
jgi:hypothetical protein